MAAHGEVTLLLKRIQNGDAGARNALMPLVMDELRRLARHYMRGERIGHTLQPTALVNEAYLRMAGYERMDWQSRAHFIGVAATIMRQVLLDYARKRQATKRGADEDAFSLDEHRDSISVSQAEELLALDRALAQLEAMNSRQAKVIELRYFGGLTVEETAETLGVSPITVKRDWTIARAWLRGQLEEGTGGEQAQA